MNDNFRIPIYYNVDKIELNQNIITDLELTSNIDPSNQSICSYYMNLDNDFSKKVAEQTVRYYTTDVSFLQDTQKFLSEYKRPTIKYTDISPNYTEILNIWNELKIDSGFKEKYYYVDWEMIEFLNKSSSFLQFMSIYNLFSPIISLFIPIIILILPFFIIKAKGSNLSISEYIDVLKLVAQHNPLGKLFTTNFADIKISELIYTFISIAFYIFSIYQNIMVCVRFNNNMVTIHNYFKSFKEYLNTTILSMDNYLSVSTNLESYSGFNDVLREKKILLTNIYNKILTISDYSVLNINKLTEIGNILKYFYELHSDKIYADAIIYSFGFNGYIDCLEGIITNIENRNIHSALFIREKKDMIIKNSYYACLKNTGPVKNTIKFKKNMIITGPNASGKTTILKSTLINILFSQQFGYGFYDSAKVVPFKYIHCYLNIPDTSGRDSLFQAEARRCKEILDTVKLHSKENHFCIFDELYSGTNPEEAELSSTAFMNYLIKFKNVSCLLTTHFIKVCRNLKNNKQLINCCMVTKKEGDKLVYEYKLENGISDVKGGISVLTEMNYPIEIINETIKKYNRQ